MALQILSNSGKSLELHTQMAKSESMPDFTDWLTELGSSTSENQLASDIDRDSMIKSSATARFSQEAIMGWHQKQALGNQS
jgi:hypothetical protein